MDERREVLVRRMMQLRHDIQSIFNEFYVWNLAHLDQEPVNPDPYGELQHYLNCLDESLAHERRLNGGQLPDGCD